MKAFVFKNPMHGIGFNDTIPWHSKISDKYFNELTIGKGNNAVVLGYNTFKNMNYKPLPNRRNYIMTRCPDIVAESCGSDVIFESSVENIQLLEFIFDEVFIIGGESIYALFAPFFTEIYVIVIDKYTRVDSFFLLNLKEYEKYLIKEIQEDSSLLSFYLYVKK